MCYIESVDVGDIRLGFLVMPYMFPEPISGNFPDYVLD